MKVLLVLYAVTVAPLSCVAPAREVLMQLAALVGTNCGASIAAGVVALALG